MPVRVNSTPPDHSQDATSTEAVALFHDAPTLQGAVDVLLTHGFDHCMLSVLANERIIAAKLGHSYVSTAELEDDPDVPRADHVPNETIGNAEGGIIAAAAYFPAVIGSLVAAASGGTLLVSWEPRHLPGEPARASEHCLPAGWVACTPTHLDEHFAWGPHPVGEDPR